VSRNIADQHVAHTKDEKVWIGFQGEAVPVAGDVIRLHANQGGGDYKVVSRVWFLEETLVHASTTREYAHGDHSTQVKASARVLIEKMP